jgi:hypothetical protein
LSICHFYLVRLVGLVSGLSLSHTQQLQKAAATFYRPHPAREAKPYKVRDARALLEAEGVKPGQIPWRSKDVQPKFDAARKTGASWATGGINDVCRSRDSLKPLGTSFFLTSEFFGCVLHPEFRNPTAAIYKDLQTSKKSAKIKRFQNSKGKQRLKRLTLESTFAKSKNKEEKETMPAQYLTDDQGRRTAAVAPIEE